MIQIHNFRGEITDMSAKTKSLLINLLEEGIALFCWRACCGADSQTSLAAGCNTVGAIYTPTKKTGNGVWVRRPEFVVKCTYFIDFIVYFAGPSYRKHHTVWIFHVFASLLKICLFEYLPGHAVFKCALCPLSTWIYVTYICCVICCIPIQSPGELGC